MNKKMSKRQKDLKSKLMAAICMLLVSSIMLVSTTYAWFTLSTAPEVTGITTAVGANGNLEMALLPADQSASPEDFGITTGTPGAALNQAAKNITWGNLVDLSDNTTYGLDKINLYPAALNTTSDGRVNTTAPLMFPTYGADGRVNGLVGNTSTGIYSTANSTFSPDSFYGVRAVGSASGMTDRQLSYRNARTAAQGAMSYAAQLAGISLGANGDALANIAIKRATGGDKFTQDDINALQQIITDLTKDDGVLDQIETAYMQYLLALSASALSPSDAAWSAIKNAVEAEDATLSGIVTKLTENGVDLSPFTALSDGIDKYDDMLDAVQSAQSLLNTANKNDTSHEYAWTDIENVLTALANPASMKVNDIPVSEIKENMSKLVTSALGGIRVTLASGAGVYADIADQTDNFSADIQIEKVEYAGETIGPLPAKMNTSGMKPSYLEQVGTAVAGAGAPAGGEAGSVPITDMYGYIIDMAFRTNAASSSLVLQVPGVDRIYKENTTGVEVGENGQSTMGNGANMTFTSTNATFTNEMMARLMQAVRLVFFDANGNILKYGKLSTATTPTAEGGLKADIVLCDATSATSTTVYFTKVETGNPTYTVYCTDDTLAVPFCRSYTEEVSSGEGEEATTTTVTKWQTYTPGEGEAAGTWSEASDSRPGNIPSELVETEAGLAPSADQKIMPLTQNNATRMSVMVYLDGENITNADVAATGSSSCNAKLNLQFASDANLTPMNYTPLMNQSGGTPETTAAATEPTT